MLYIILYSSYDKSDFHQVADDIDQVQDNIVVILRVPVFRFADDIDRDTERYSTTLTVLM